MHEAREKLAGFVGRSNFVRLVGGRGQIDGLRRIAGREGRLDHRVGRAHLFRNPLRSQRGWSGRRSGWNNYRGAARVRRGSRSATTVAAIVFLVAMSAELFLALVQEVAWLPAELVAAIIALADFGPATCVLAAVVVLLAPIALEAMTLVVAAIVLGTIVLRTRILLGTVVLLMAVVASVLVAVIVLVATIVRLLTTLLPAAQLVLDLLDQATLFILEAAIATNRSLAATIARVVIHVINNRWGRCGWRRRNRIGTGHARREQENSSVQGSNLRMDRYIGKTWRFTLDRSNFLSPNL